MFEAEGSVMKTSTCFSHSAKNRGSCDRNCSGTSTFRERTTLSDERKIVTIPPAFCASMARASISGTVCFPPVITTTSPGLIPTDVVTMRRANRCRFGCWAVAAERARHPRARLNADPRFLRACGTTPATTTHPLMPFGRMGPSLQETLLPERVSPKKDETGRVGIPLSRSRDWLPSRHGRTARHAASGLMAPELRFNMRTGPRAARFGGGI